MIGKQIKPSWLYQVMAFVSMELSRLEPDLGRGWPALQGMGGFLLSFIQLENPQSPNEKTEVQKV